VTDSAEPRVVGYYSLTVGQVDTLQAPERVRKGMGQYPIPVVPVVLLARQAVDTRYHRRGIGAGMLRDAIVRAVTISEQASVRVVVQSDGPLVTATKLRGKFNPRLCRPL